MRLMTGISRLALACTIISWALAIGPAALLIKESTIILLAILSGALLIYGALGIWTNSEPRYLFALGGQMVWSLCALSLSGLSVAPLWGLLFLHLMIIITGTRGLWAAAHQISKVNGHDDKTRTSLLKNVVLAYEWLGASAVISAVLLFLTPWFVIPGSGIELLIVVMTLALVSFALLASQLRSSG